MNKLIVFGGSHNHCKEILVNLQDLLPENHDIQLVYLDTASAVADGIQSFTVASRAILINCQLVGEGVDIPCADSVSILCNKRSYSQIVQNLLRPGRAFEGKEKFYMIMALNDDDDIDFIGYVLDALAQIDPLLEKQILMQALGGQSKTSLDVVVSTEDSPLDTIILSEEADGSDLVKIKKCLENVIHRRVGSATTRFQFHQLREICKKRGIKNTSAYNAIREDFSWPEAPWSIRDMTAYDFFHGAESERISPYILKESLKRYSISTTEMYIEWQRNNPEFPSVEDINDGYFGSTSTNLQSLLPPVGRRR